MKYFIYILPNFILIQLRGYGCFPNELKLHASYDANEERAKLLTLNNDIDDDDDENSYTYLLSLGGDLAGKVRELKVPRLQTEDDQTGDLPSVVSKIASLVRNSVDETYDGHKDNEDTLNIDDEHKNIEDTHGFTSLSGNNSNSRINFPTSNVPKVGMIINKDILMDTMEDTMESRIRPEPRIPPPPPTRKTYNMKRTSPMDVVGFSAVRASGFSRVGESRIFFENTLTDANYGWDSRNSLFITHYPGLYFFTFSVKADADQGDNFKYEVSLMKNGEEVVSVGGAVDPSTKNTGTSASNSVIIKLEKEDRVWLQLLRGNLVETKNMKTGYSSFSGYKLGCGPHPTTNIDLDDVVLEDLADELDKESLNSLDNDNDPFHNHIGVTEKYEDSVDRLGNVNRYGLFKDHKDEGYKNRPVVYNEDKLYDAFDYQKDKLRPAHRPFVDPPIVDRNAQTHSSNDDGFSDHFNEKKKYSSDRININDDRYSSQDRHSNKDRYTKDDMYSKYDRNSYDERPSNDKRYSSEDRYSSSDLHSSYTDRKSNTDRYSTSDRYSSYYDKHSDDDRDSSYEDRYSSYDNRNSNANRDSTTDRYSSYDDRKSNDNRDSTTDRYSSYDDRKSNDNTDSSTDRYSSFDDKHPNDDGYQSYDRRPSNDNRLYSNKDYDRYSSGDDKYSDNNPEYNSYSMKTKKYSYGSTNKYDNPRKYFEKISPNSSTDYDRKAAVMFFQKRTNPPISDQESHSDTHLSYGK